MWSQGNVFIVPFVTTDLLDVLGDTIIQQSWNVYYFRIHVLF